MPAGRVVALVEQSRWSPVKRTPTGAVEFIAPFPCPFNYGCIPGTVSGDGDALDVLILGPRIPRGARVEVEVCGIVDFVDGGLRDPKVVAAPPATAITRGSWTDVERFFRVYAAFRRVLDRFRGRPGPTGFRGWLRHPVLPSRVEGGELGKSRS